MIFRTRFAPSPTGPLHIGHAYSAILAHDMAKEQNGEFLLRIEDIDQTRARREWEQQIYDDLAWLGLSWPEPVMRQSERLPVYRSSLETMWDRKALFACNCSRRDIEEATNAPQEGAPMGPDGIVYPGTCRRNGNSSGEVPYPDDKALRLHMSYAAIDIATHGIDGDVISFLETGEGENGRTGNIDIDVAHIIENIGDVVLKRQDFGTSYHLSVVLDDAAQNITHVVRGRDLFDATAIHVVLQRYLDLPTPTYHHHKLIRDDNGKRLAKRDDARAISTFRKEGYTPNDIRRIVGL